ncbi:SAF domain-containing protein [Kitasatospora sp. NPDC091207]|uniref:SAF domain-containing protein n=1 Tax=Kitasatospora sp. NPDC091207 TaxID=3364083 RepID=UPI0038056F0F
MSVAVPEQGRGAPHAPGRNLRARRRRPAVLAMAVALIAAGGLGGAVLYNSTGQRVAVLALARDVPFGQVVTDADLVVARIATDPALKPVAAEGRQRAVGRRATTDLRRGALLLDADLAQNLTVQPGQLVVGVSAKRTQLPASRLQSGVAVVVVYTPDSGRPESLSALVVTIGRVDTDGSQVVDVAVAAADAPRLASWVASGRIQVVLAPRGVPAGAPAPSGAGAASGTAAPTAPAAAPGSAAPSGAGGG